MRCASGTAWGCDTSTLLVLYRAYIRSCMEYGCQAFDNAAPLLLFKAVRFVFVQGPSDLPLYLSYKPHVMNHHFSYADVNSSMLQHLRSLRRVIIPYLVSWNITLFRTLEPLNIGRRLVWLLRISLILWSGLSDFAKRWLMSLNGILFLLSLCLSKSLSPVVLKFRTIFEHLKNGIISFTFLLMVPRPHPLLVLHSWFPDLISNQPLNSTTFPFAQLK